MIAYHTIMGGCSLPKTVMVSTVVLINAKGHGGITTVFTLTSIVFIHQLLLAKISTGITGKVIIIP